MSCLDARRSDPFLLTPACPAFNQLLKGELAATVQIYPLKQLRQGLPILMVSMDPGQCNIHPASPSKPAILLSAAGARFIYLLHILRALI